MQININSNISKVNHHYNNYYRTPNKTMSSPMVVQQTNIIFTANPIATKTVSTKIASEKAKFLRHFKEILATNIPERTEEDIIMAMIAKAHSLIDKLERRHQEISDEMDAIIASKTMNQRQKYDAGKKLINELNRLDKINPFEKPKILPKVSSDDYDYVLINKFKNAILNDNFDLAKVFTEHYSELESIKTLEELKSKYPSIKIPKTPKDVISQKIIDIIPRKFYEQLDEVFQLDDREITANSLAQFYENFFTKLAPIFDMDSAEELFKLIGQEVAEKCINIYYQLVEKGSMSSIPETRKSYVPAITSLDKQLLHIDFDKFALSVIRQQYLEGKKLSEITYQENKKTISLSEIKSSEYKFEKVSEKIKKFIADSEKVRLAQRDYQKFTPNELKARLNHYLNTELGNNEKFLEIFIDFDSCKFTEEDKQYLIKFLQKLDEISDGKTTLEEAIEYTEQNNIKPHGTVKLNEVERKNLEEKIRIEQQKNIQLNHLRKEFSDIINRLYEYNLSNIAEEFMEYYPENLEEESINNAKQIIEVVEDSIKLEDSNKIKTSILRWKIYNEYSKKPNQETLFAQAMEYGNSFGENDAKQRCGQYLLNRELLNNYPASKEFFSNPEMAERIIEKFGSDSNLATLYLCKYENYKMLEPSERQYLLKILEIFNYKDANDKVILKNIIENDYINIETHVQNEHLNKEIVITPSAKQGVMNKYKFPSCIDLFLAFEDAMNLSASKQGTSGVKRVETGGKAGLHQIELKIMGFPDRLFSSNNDFIFDIYSEKGLH